MWSITRFRCAFSVVALAAGLLVTTARWTSARKQGHADDPKASNLALSVPSPSSPPLELRGEFAAGIVSPPKAVVRIEGKPQPGHALSLNAEGPAGADVRYRWVQTRGPAVLLADSSARTASFTVPDGNQPMGFLLAVSNSDGVDVAQVSIPVDVSVRTEGSATAPLRADAGDEQVALVGRQVTLNGVRSEPKGNIGYRWLQVGGPPVRMKLEDGYIYSFLPTSAGVYRFALVVASGSRISEPNIVTVTVGSGNTTRTAGEVAGAAPPVAIPTQELARSGFASVGGTTQIGEDLAGIFEVVSDRMDLYQSYSDAFSEMSRRLEEMLARDPARRNLWVERVFTPLTARVIEVLQAEGLDLRTLEGQAAAMAPHQRAALAEQFRLMADGIRNHVRTH